MIGISSEHEADLIYEPGIKHSSELRLSLSWLPLSALRHSRYF